MEGAADNLTPPLDPRLNAIRPDLADAALRGKIAAPRYAEGRPAWVSKGLAPVRHEPRQASTVDTFFHFGEAVRVFEQIGGYAWCQSSRDGYVGYVESAPLRPGEPPASGHFISALGTYRYAEPDLRAQAIDILPRHSAIAVTRAGLQCRGAEYAELAGGGFVPAPCLSHQPPWSTDLVAAVSLYLGCPYLWGGRSFLGIDCSGLVQEGFRDLGLAVPRDTDMQQEAIGFTVKAAAIGDLRRNDLVFMPGHVMIYAGDGQVIHAYGGDMTVRRDDLAALMQGWGRSLGDFVIRRP